MFLTFSQNNSGGYNLYDEKDGIGDFVIIEGTNLDEITKKSKKIFKNYSEFCDCCGERWDEYFGEGELKNEPEIYEESAYGFHGDYIRGDCAYLHYTNEKIEKIILK